MAHWQEPPPFVWTIGAKQQPLAEVIAGPKLHPNLFARYVRVSVRHRGAWVVIISFMIATALSILMFAEPPAQDVLQPVTPRADRITRSFPGSDQQLVVSVSSNQPGVAFERAQQLVSELNAAPPQSLLEPPVLLNGASQVLSGTAYDRPLVDDRLILERLTALQPMHQQILRNPSAEGLALSLNAPQPSGSDALAQRRQRQAQAAFLAQLTRQLQTSQGQQSGDVTSGFWPSLLAPETQVPMDHEARLILLAKPGQMEALRLWIENAMQRFRLTSDGVTVSLSPMGLSEEEAGKDNRTLIVAAALSLLLTIIVLVVALRATRHVILILLPLMVSWFILLAVLRLALGAFGPALAGLMLVSPPLLAMLGLFIHRLMRHEGRAISQLSHLMMAAQQSAGVIVASLVTTVGLWAGYCVLMSAWPLAWLGLLMITTSLGAILLVMGLTPAFAAMAPAHRTAYIGEHPVQSGYGFVASSEVGKHQQLLGVAALVLLLGYIFYAGMQLAWGHWQPFTVEPLQVVVADRPEATRLVESLRASKDIGGVEWAEDFFIPDFDAKAEILHELAALQLPALAQQQSALSEEAQTLTSAQNLQAALKQLALEPDPPELSTAARNLLSALEAAGLEQQNGQRLRTTGAAMLALNTALHADIAGFGPYLKSISEGAMPNKLVGGAALQALYVNPQGQYRIITYPSEPAAPSFIPSVLNVAPQAWSKSLANAPRFQNTNANAVWVLPLFLIGLIVVAVIILRDLRRISLFIGMELLSALSIAAGIILFNLQPDCTVIAAATAALSLASFLNFSAMTWPTEEGAARFNLVTVLVSLAAVLPFAIFQDDIAGHTARLMVLFILPLAVIPIVPWVLRPPWWQNINPEEHSASPDVLAHDHAQDFVNEDSQLSTKPSSDDMTEA